MVRPATASPPVVSDDPDALELARWLRRGDRIVVTQALAEPVALTRALAAQRAEFGQVSLFCGPLNSPTLRPEHGDHIAFVSYCGSGANHAFVSAGVMDILPAHYSTLESLYAGGTLGCDVVLVLLGEDGRGGYNTGIVCDHVVDAARRARVVIAEVSDRVPCTPGADWPADLAPDVIVRTSREPLVLERGAITEAARRLAGNVASLVPDGATIETGVGTMPDLVLDALSGHRHLGFHSGALTEAVVDLMERGVITNAHKPIDAGVAVGGLLFGTRRLFDFADRNPSVRLAPPSYTHNQRNLALIPKLVAVNGALQVDLTGQVNAEQAGGRYIGAVGGQVDFTRGAAHSPGGRSIVMVNATARGGRESNIVPRLPDGVVTAARSDADTIVTEWGIAELKGRTLSERVSRMIAIADPAFREELERAGHALLAGRADQKSG